MNRIYPLLICLFLIALGNSCNNISAGSYPYAQRYRLKIKEKDLIEVIKKFKYDNPDYCVPEEVKLIDGRRNEKELWYHIYFYYKDENILVNTWIRQKDQEYTTFAFVALNEGLTLGNWKDVNNDFTNEENERVKEIFEQRILNKINAIIKNDF